MSVFGKGWKPDLEHFIEECRQAGDARHDAHFPKYGARAAARPVKHDGLSVFCDYRDQRFSSACVGFAITTAAQARLNRLGYRVGRFSPLVPYGYARQKEGLYKNKQLPDDGCHPFLALPGVRQFGLTPEAIWPFDDSYADRVLEELPVDVFQTASACRIATFSRIEDVGQARVEACMDALLADHPVLLGMQVGREFEAYRPGLGPVGIETKNTGAINAKSTRGHMTFLVGYEDNGDTFIGCNSWSRSYGDGGRYRISRDKLTHASTTDLYDFVVAA